MSKYTLESIGNVVAFHNRNLMAKNEWTFLEVSSLNELELRQFPLSRKPCWRRMYAEPYWVPDGGSKFTFTKRINCNSSRTTRKPLNTINAWVHLLFYTSNTNQNLDAPGFRHQKMIVRRRLEFPDFSETLSIVLPVARKVTYIL